MARDPDRIEDEIEVTRARIESRLEALSSQFTPANIVERALGTDDLGSHDSLEAIAHKARQSPISAALIGAGLVGLFLAGRNETPSTKIHRESARQPAANLPSDEADPAKRVSSHIDRLEDAARSGAGDVKRTAADAVDSIKQGAKSARDTMTGAVDSVSSTVGNAAESAIEAARAAPVRARAQSEMAVDWIKENPLPAGLMALAAGAALSSLFAARRAGDLPADRYRASRELHEEARQEEELRAMRRADAEHLARNAPKPAAEPRKPATKSKKTAGARTRKPAAAKTAATKTSPASRIERDTAVLGEKPDKG